MDQMSDNSNMSFRVDMIRLDKNKMDKFKAKVNVEVVPFALLLPEFFLQ